MCINYVIADVDIQYFIYIHMYVSLSMHKYPKYHATSTRIFFPHTHTLTRRPYFRDASNTIRDLVSSNPTNSFHTSIHVNLTHISRDAVGTFTHKHIPDMPHTHRTHVNLILFYLRRGRFAAVMTMLRRTLRCCNLHHATSRYPASSSQAQRRCDCRQGGNLMGVFVLWSVFTSITVSLRVSPYASSGKCEVVRSQEGIEKRYAHTVTDTTVIHTQ